MQIHFLRCAASSVAILLCSSYNLCLGSDHADPQNVTNPFFVLSDPEANITDLHAFLVDDERRLITKPEDIAKADQLIISLCARRRLLPEQEGALKLDGYVFRVHLDLDPPVRFFSETTPDGKDYQTELAKLSAIVDEQRKALAKATAQYQEKAMPESEAALANARKTLTDAVEKRAAFIAAQDEARWLNPDPAHNADRSMQALYGGIITQPAAIAEEAVLEFELDLVKDVKDPGGRSQAKLVRQRAEGIAGQINVVAEQKTVHGVAAIAESKWKPGAINVQAGIFDDPFIFPRFFRGNVVGIVASIPLSQLRLKGGASVKSKLERPIGADGKPASPLPILVWATTHKGNKQIDHVGRSLRTQLPRFGYLNDKNPADHVAEITKVHDKPNLMEDVLATFLSPLEAHRHYDSVPDVMIYDLRRPASFPNGRALADDISKTLADAGETLLFELSYAESRQFPRATTNDKPFREDFPYLAERWTRAEIEQYKAQSAPPMPGGFIVPLAQDGPATAFPTFKDATWQSLWLGEIIGVCFLALVLILTLRSNVARLLTLLTAIVTVCALQPVRVANLMAGNQVPAMHSIFHPGSKLQVIAAVIAGILALIVLLVKVRSRCAWLALLLAAIITAGAYKLTHAADLKPGSIVTVMDVMRQPGMKMMLVLIGVGVIALFSLLWIFALGRRCGARQALPVATPLDNEDIADDDRSYEGTTYEEVHDAVFSEPYKVLSTQELSFRTFAKGLLGCCQRFRLGQAAGRTIVSDADLRWGRDKKGFQRLVHPNGICLAGTWEVTGQTQYTGYFKTGSKCLIIGRYSSGGLGIRGGQLRSLSLVGKLYPTLDPVDKKCYRPANFFTQENLAGSVSQSIWDVALLNAPDVTPSRRGWRVFPFLLLIGTLIKTDREPSVRQLYEIAELGKDPHDPTSCPKFMRLTVAGTPPAETREGLDFRKEIVDYIYNKPNPQPLVFKIEVSDAGEVKTNFSLAKPVKELTGATWREIGKIEFNQAAASYNGDFVIHFHHPAWRKDANVPGSESGPENKWWVRLLKWLLS